MARLLSKKFICLLFVNMSFSFVFAHTAFADSGITYHGRLLKPDGTPVLATNVQFRLQVRTPGVENCLLYEEIQNANLSTSNGLFAVSLGDATGSRQDSYTWSMFDAFSNRKAFSALSNCTGPTTYTPNAADNRRFQVSFNDGTFAPGTWEDLPSQFINYIPMSIESFAVGGFTAQSLVRVETSGTLGNITPLNATQYAEILALVGGTSAQYSRTTHLNGSALPTLSAGQSVRWTGSAWQAYTPPTNASLPTCTAGQVLTSNGSALSCVAGGGGVVDGDDITSGTIGGTTAWNTSGNITTSGTITATGAITGGSLSGSTVSTRDLRVYESTNTNYISIQAPSGLTPNYSLTLPADDGASGQVLSTNGSGVLSWWTPTSANFNLANIRSTVNSMNPVFPSVACATSETLRYDSLTDTYQCSAVTVGAASGALLNGGNTNGAAVVAGTNDAFDFQLETANTPRMTILSGGNVGIGVTDPGFKLTVQGLIASQNSASSDSLQGGVSLRRTRSDGADPGANFGSAYDVSLEGATAGTLYLASRIATFWENTVTSSASSRNSALSFSNSNAGTNTEHMRLSSRGYLGIGTDDPARLLHANGPMRLTASALPTTPAAGDIAVDSADGNKLKWHNGTTWQTVGTSTASGDLLNGGNAGVVTVGSNDSTLALETNNVTRMSITAGGSVGVGTTAPTSLLNVHTNTASSTPRTLILSNAATPDYNVGSELGFQGATAAEDMGGIEARWLGANTDSEINIKNRQNSSIVTSFKIGGNSYPGAVNVNVGQQPGGSMDTRHFAVFTPTTFGDSAVNNLLLLHYDSDSGGSAGIGSKVLFSAETSTNDTYGEAGAISGVLDDVNPLSTDGSLRFETLGPNASATADHPTEKMRITSSGYVGIGTNNPARLLHANGPMRLTASALPLTPGAGDLAVDSGDANKLKWYDGTTWQSAGTSSAALSFPLLASPAVTTHGAPSYSFTGDADTGLYSPAANEVSITAGGTRVATFGSAITDLNNDVRIGKGWSGLYAPTSTGSYIPQIIGPVFYNANWTTGTIAGNTIAVSNASGTGQNAYIGAVSNASGHTPTIVIGQQTGATAYLERVRIDTNGNFGIGATNPVSKLTVGSSLHADGIRLAGTSNWTQLATNFTTASAWNGLSQIGDQALVFGTTAVDVDPGGFVIGPWTTAARGMRMDGNGNVGLGEVSPASKLHIKGSGDGLTVESNAVPFLFREGDQAEGFVGKYWRMPIDNGELRFDLSLTGNSLFSTYVSPLTIRPSGDVLTVLGTGNMGVGTSSPGVKLDVMESARVRSTTTWPIMYSQGGAASGGFAGHFIASNSRAGAHLQSGDILGSIAFRSSVSGESTDIHAMATANHSATSTPAEIRFRTTPVGSTAGTVRMVIGATGDVGIGITSPGYMLHVNGTAGKPGGGSWTDSSDRRLKKDIAPMGSALDELMLLKPVTYEWINPNAHQPGRHSGFIAQEVEEVFPGWVSENAPPKGDEALIPEGENSKSLSFPHDFNAYIVKALQEVVGWLKGHDREIASLKSENLKLKSDNEAIKAYLCAKDPQAPLCK